MALSELQISDLLGYIADPNIDVVTTHSEEHISYIIMVMAESHKQRNQGLLPVVKNSWVDFLPWHSVN